MTLQNILSEIGAFGRYQKWKIFLIGMIFPPLAFYMFSVVFTYESPPHRCFIPEIDGGISSSEKTGNNVSEILENFIPLTQFQGEDKLSSCERYQNTNQSNATTGYQFVHSNITENCKDGWVYDDNRVSAVVEFDLVCKDAWKKPLLTSGLMFGMMLGGLFGGSLTDRFGRRPVILLFLAVSPIVHTTLSFLNFYWLLLILVALSGALHAIIFTTSFVLGQELVGFKDRAKVTCIINLCCGVGYMLLPTVAYFVINWRWILRFNASFHLIYIPYYWLLPESPRFLFSKGRRKEMLSMIQNIAKTNGVDLENVKDKHPETFCLMEQNRSAPSEKTEKEDKRKAESIKMLIKNPVMLKRTLCLFFIWNAVFLCFYASAFNTSNLGGNKYLNCFISASVEIPASVLILFSLQKIGRRNSLFCFLFLAGTGCLLSPVFQNEVLSISSAMMAKLFATCGIGSVFLFTSELYPTLLRNTGVGFCTMAARFSTISAPYLIFIGEQAGKAIPFYVMGVTSMLGAILLLIFPETYRSPLPETLEDAVNLEKHRLKICRGSMQSKDNEMVQLS